MSSSPKCADPGGAFRRIRREATLLLLLALVPAALSAWLHPRSPFHSPAGGEVAKVDLATVRGWPGPVLWVDARPAPAFASAHIPGALHLTEREWEERLGEFVAQWRPGIRVVVYCDGAKCNASLSVARRLKRELQIEQVHVLAGGWEAWQAAPKP